LWGGSGGGDGFFPATPLQEIPVRRADATARSDGRRRLTLSINPA
jgi:hypothetical protein